MEKELKAKVLKAMQDSKYNFEEADRAVSFVLELLATVKENTKINEPHATLSIKDMEEAIKNICMLYEVLEEAYGDA